MIFTEIDISKKMTDQRKMLPKIPRAMIWPISQKTWDMLEKTLTGSQCPKTDLDKRFLPRPKTTTA